MIRSNVEENDSNIGRCIMTYRRNKTDCQLTLLNGSFNGSIKHGGVIQCNCLDGYKLVGNEYLRCRNGNFLEEPPRCFANCESSISIVNGQYSGSYTHGGSITFTCDVGYTLVGKSTITCYNGFYSFPYAECRPTCSSKIRVVNGEYEGNITTCCDSFGVTFPEEETVIFCNQADYSSSYPTSGFYQWFCACDCCNHGYRCW
ncbi:C4b-binding protein alpha chain-like [Antedon mediterranea]|uniref:C4b-binding protein alpha chain-like n=1 Tax=Antedon mediterranea TaxID=105859 RepID=UPI003AF7AECA